MNKKRAEALIYSKGEAPHRYQAKKIKFSSNEKYAILSLELNEDFSSGPNTQQYIKFKVAVSKLLCRSPYFIRIVNNRFVKQDSIRHIDLWNTYLDNHWNRGKSLLNKVE
ncbi:hypothetical protein [Bacillus cereus]|uniref:hypothetical protein n=1 Tax=Bacillus cereus group TaxID=86661 RepID=UPI0022EC802A|nr:hypothetical protein [Bacillus cereus]MDA4083520.1 hypothetical protein [Bacillus cereus]